MREIRYDKTISFKISLHQYDELQNFSLSENKDVSEILREIIDEKIHGEEYLRKRINFLSYEIQQLQKRLTKIQEDKEKKKEKDEKNIKENLEKIKIKHHNKEAEEKSLEIMKKFGKKFTGKFSNPKSLEFKESRKKSIAFLKNELKKVDHDLKEKTAEEIAVLINKLHFNFEKEEILKKTQVINYS